MIGSVIQGRDAASIVSNPSSNFVLGKLWMQVRCRAIETRYTFAYCSSSNPAGRVEVLECLDHRGHYILPEPNSPESNYSS